MFLYAREPGLHPVECSIVPAFNVVYLVIQFVGNVVEQMATLIQELENVQDKRPVLDKRLPTKVSCIQYEISLPT